MTATSPPTTNHQPQATLPGWVSTFYVIQNRIRRGPYYVRRWKVAGKLQKQYVKPADLPRIRAACQANRDQQLAYRFRSEEIANTCANLDYLVRMVKRLKHGPLRPEDDAHLMRIQAHGIDCPGRPPVRRTIARNIAFLDDAPALQSFLNRNLTSIKHRLERGFMVPHFYKSSKTHPSVCADGSCGGGGGKACPERGTSEWRPVAAHKTPGEEFENAFAATHSHLPVAKQGEIDGVVRGCIRGAGGGGSGFGSGSESDATTPNPLPSPRISARQLDQMKKDFKQIRDAAHPETTEQKWARWQKEYAKVPKAPRVYRPRLPSWLTQQEIDDQIAGHFDRLKCKTPPAEPDTNNSQERAG